jgi:hypothetical protein
MEQVQHNKTAVYSKMEYTVGDGKVVKDFFTTAAD